MDEDDLLSAEKNELIIEALSESPVFASLIHKVYRKLDKYKVGDKDSLLRRQPFMKELQAIVREETKSQSPISTTPPPPVNSSPKVEFGGLISPAFKLGGVETNRARRALPPIAPHEQSEADLPSQEYRQSNPPSLSLLADEPSRPKKVADDEVEKNRLAREEAETEDLKKRLK